ncbi:MAG: hypothetical protein M3O28_06645 [Actinomycetota bacterium]|nr:hypothetical protein [Actinomycetota bacterium]
MSHARTNQRLAVLLGAAITLTAITGCGSGSKSAPSATGQSSAPSIAAAAATSAAATSSGGTARGSSVDPCSLLTQAEVDAAAGQALGPGKPTIPHYDCTWTTSDFAASVTLTISDWTAIKAAATGNGHPPTPVSGVGDEALTKGGGLLYVRKGSAGFLLMIAGAHLDSLPDKGLAAEKVLAAAVFGRL